MRLTFIGAPTAPGTGVVDQTLEILADSGSTWSHYGRVFTVNIGPDRPGNRPRPPRRLTRGRTYRSSPTATPTDHYTQLPGLLTSPMALEPYASSSTAAGCMLSTARA